MQKKTASHAGWRYNNKCSSMPQGKVLRLMLLSPALVHWSMDGWTNSEDTNTTDTGLGVYFVDLPATELPVSSRVCFTFLWGEENKWEGTDFELVIKHEGTETKASSVLDQTLAPLK